MKCSTHRTSTSTYMSQCVSPSLCSTPTNNSVLAKGWMGVFQGVSWSAVWKKVEKTRTQTVQESWIVNGSPRPCLVTLCESTCFTFWNLPDAICNSLHDCTQALLELHKVMTVMMSPLRFYKCLMVLEHRSQPMGTGDWHSRASWWQNRAVE